MPREDEIAVPCEEEDHTTDAEACSCCGCRTSDNSSGKISDSCCRCCSCCRGLEGHGCQGIRIKMGHFVLTVWPIVFVWLLPVLAKHEWLPLQAALSYGVRFANRCAGFPDNCESALGLSVSNFISTPMATGMMAMSFYWVILHLWKERRYVRKYVPGGVELLFGFTFFFGAFLAAPTTVYPIAHSVVVAIFCTLALIVYWFLLQHTPQKDEWSGWWCKLLLIASTSAFGGVVILSGVGNFAPTGWFNNHGLWWAFYAFEATGLSCMAIFPWVWQPKDMLDPRDEEFGQTCRGTTLRLIVFLKCVAPTLYVWLLPVLALPSIDFAHRCPGFPACKGTLFSGPSVFNLASSTQATGLFAALFFWPMATLWAHRVELTGFVGSQLFKLIFVLYGTLLTCPQAVWPNLNAICRISLVVCMSVYFVLVMIKLRPDPPYDTLCRAMMGVAVTCFTGDFLVSVGNYVMVKNGNHWIEEHLRWIVFFFQAMALSSFSIMSWFLSPDARQGIIFPVEKRGPLLPQKMGPSGTRCFRGDGIVFIKQCVSRL